MRLKIQRFAAGLGLSIYMFLGTCARPQSMPSSIAGTWRIVKILQTRNVQCWNEVQARSMVGTTLTYQERAMVWHGVVEPISAALSRTLSRRGFLEEYKVDLPELGIAADSVEEIDLQHEDADLT